MRFKILMLTFLIIGLKMKSQTICICDLTFKDSIYYNNGLIYTGQFNEMYKNGKIRQEGFIKYGKLDSTISTFNKDGKLTEIDRFKNNILINRTLYFYTAFAKKIVTFKDNIENGLYAEYYSNGLPKDSGYYSMGKPIGKWTYWNKTGLKYLEITNFKDYVEHKNYVYSKDSVSYKLDYFDLKGKQIIK
jgi:antitoxin component YwqK of YwqJK toxin-antitoxin module